MDRGGGQQPSATMKLGAKIIYIDFHEDILYFCNIVKIVILYGLLSFRSPFSCDLLRRRMFDEAWLECYKSLGPVLPAPFS